MVARDRPVVALLAVAVLAACAPALPPPVPTPAPAAPCPTASSALSPPPPAPAPLPPSVPDTPAEHALAQLFADAWETTLREEPLFASSLGDRRYNDRWGEVSVAAFARRRAADVGYLERLRSIAREELSPPSQLNRDLFERKYALAVEGQAFDLEYLAMNQREGLQTAGDWASELRFADRKDYEDWLRRMETFPEHVDETIAVMREGIKRRVVQPRVVMDRVLSQIDRQLAAKPDDSPFFAPFKKYPRAVSDAEQARLARAARRAVLLRILPAYKLLQAFLAKEYLPACFDHVGAWQLPRGDEAYAYLARVNTTTSLTPEEIHAIGEREVARIRGEMQRAMEKAGFTGSLKDFFAMLRSDPRFFYKDGEALLEGYRNLAKRIDPLLVKLVKKLPRTPYGVEPIPDSAAPETTTAYYSGPADDGSRAGTYFVNLYKPESRPKWEMIALTLHESVPGHHLQLALAQEQTALPEFRRHAYDGYTAFVEGWGLYAESLGEDIGLYDDPYDKFGQLAYEMWRAIRLVVDTGIHAMKWDRQRAIDYFLDNDPKAPLDVTNEIDRYIVTPGQALAYKLGELKIKELRARAKEKLGARFDLREFHDVVLERGAVTLDLLERHVDEWIARKSADGS